MGLFASVSDSDAGRVAVKCQKILFALFVRFLLSSVFPTHTDSLYYLFYSHNIIWLLLEICSRLGFHLGPNCLLGSPFVGLLWCEKIEARSPHCSTCTFLNRVIILPVCCADAYLHYFGNNHYDILRSNFGSHCSLFNRWTSRMCYQ
jgi:hypothetical protein